MDAVVSHSVGCMTRLALARLHVHLQYTYTSVHAGVQGARVPVHERVRGARVQ